MKSISILARSLNRNTVNSAYANVLPDLTRTFAVQSGKHKDLLSSHPLTAGNQFHALLKRMGDDEPLSPTEKAYLPWLNVLRRAVWSLGASEMEIESPFDGYGVVPAGTCDLLVQGGPAPLGVIECKVIMKGTQNEPRGRDLAQLAAYARLASGQHSFDETWAALAYVELESLLVRLFVFKSSRTLVLQTLKLLHAA